jgi:uncharacterized protein YbjT (DUF2867 family)
MMIAKRILVTGATGSIGSMLVPQLLGQGAQVRALVRSAEKGKALEAKGAQIAIGDFEKPETLKPAMEGIKTIVLVTPPSAHAVEQSDAVIEAAKAARVKKIVRISAIMPDDRRPTDNTRQHAEADAKLMASGLSFTILRPHFYMQNLFMSAQTIGHGDTMYWGMDDGKMGMIDVRDIVDVAAKVALEDGHDGAIYTLTGPESITFHDVAKELSRALGKQISYVPVHTDAVRGAVVAMGMGDWFADVMRDYSKAYASNWGDFVTTDIEKLLGRKARSLGDFIREVFAPALAAGKPDAG